MVLRDCVSSVQFDSKLPTAAVKRFGWRPIGSERADRRSAASTEEMVLFAPATVSTFWLARVAVAPELVALNALRWPLTKLRSPRRRRADVGDRDRLRIGQGDLAV